MMKAMSHPIRWRIIAVINGMGHARVTDIADELGERANSISFHVRTLADAGVLVEAPELARDGRERVWKMAQESLSADLDLLRDDAAYRTATAASIGLICCLFVSSDVLMVPVVAYTVENRTLSPPSANALSAPGCQLLFVKRAVMPATLRACQ